MPRKNEICIDLTKEAFSFAIPVSIVAWLTQAQKQHISALSANLIRVDGPSALIPVSRGIRLTEAQNEIPPKYVLI